MIDLALARRAAVILTAAVSLLGGGVAQAQRIQSYDQSRPAGVAGQFDYYVLSLSWSPTHCAEVGRDRRDEQCDPRGRRFAFVLHGLWPQYEKGFPEFCQSRDRPFVPERVIQGMMDVMPARGLVIHQFRKHGTCSGLDAARYFETARRLYQRIKMPTRFVDPERDQTVDTQSVVNEFVAANPGLKADSVAVTCGGTGNRLREVRICFTREGEFRPCGANEDTRRMCRSPRVYVPPVRVGAATPAERPPATGQGRREILPGPVMPPSGVRNL